MRMNLQHKRACGVLLALCLPFFFFLIGIRPASADDQQTALEILDAWTSLRWGDGNVTWVVHYPEELVAPWVNTEAERRGLGAAEKEAYRKAFVDELRIGSTTAIMLSIHAFGANAVNLSPLAQNIVLIDNSGKRIRPMVVEKKFDAPISGLVQGFVYFPKQADTSFRIAIKNLLPGRETLFSFSPNESAASLIETGSNEKNPTSPFEEEVIVKIPVTKPQQPTLPEPPAPEDETPVTGETFQPTAPPEVPAEQPAEPETPEPVRPAAPTLSNRQVLDIYLKAWIDGDTDRMYELLSSESQARISKELFVREQMSGSFRNSLKTGYKIAWTGENTAKVTVSKKILLMRSLESKTVHFTKEDGSARISW